MYRLLLLPLLLLFLGCSHNHFNVPLETFAKNVKVLGVVPIITDTESDIRYPQKEQLFSMMAEMNRKYENQFVRKLKITGNYYAVSLLDGDPQRTFANLLFRREKRDDAGIRYNKYFWKNDDLRDYLKRNSLDAVMIIVVSGLTRNEKIFSSNLLTSLESDYNFLHMSAQILDANGTILWEYPNFRTRILSYDPMVNLQYPDFSEAAANLSSKPDVKFKTIDGIKRTLDRKRKDLLQRETMESEVYAKQFEEMIALLEFDRDGLDKQAIQTATGKSTQTEQQKPVEQTAKTPETVKPASPSVASEQSHTVPAATPAAENIEVVPAPQP